MKTGCTGPSSCSAETTASGEVPRPGIDPGPVTVPWNVMSLSATAVLWDGWPTSGALARSSVPVTTTFELS